MDEGLIMICPLAMHGNCDSSSFHSVLQLGMHIKTHATNNRVAYSGSKRQAALFEHKQLYDWFLALKYMTHVQWPSVHRKGIDALQLVRHERQFTEFRQGLLQADQLDVVSARGDAMW